MFPGRLFFALRLASAKAQRKGRPREAALSFSTLLRSGATLDQPQKEQQDDGEPFEEKMARLTSELSDLFVQSHKLEAEIKEKLGAIGYEI